jgi:hypothetical protein
MQQPEDFDQVEHALSDLFWDICETRGRDRQWSDALSILRARYVYAGKQQGWTYEDDEYLCLHTIARVL